MGVILRGQTRVRNSRIAPAGHTRPEPVGRNPLAGKRPQLPLQRRFVDDTMSVMIPQPESGPPKSVPESHSPQAPPSIPGHVPSPPDRSWKVTIGYSLWFWSHVRRIAIFLIGTTVVLLGVIMLVIPGPGLLTIAGGLALLATEFAWARWALKNSQDRLRELMDRVYPPANRPADPAASTPCPSANNTETGKGQ